MQTTRIVLCGAHVDAMSLDEAAATVLRWAATETGRVRCVVTPNVQHTVLLRESAPLRAVYAEADLVLADGMPLLVLARLLGKPLPERAAGSDLVPLVFERAPAGLRVFLMGAAPGVGERAAAAIEQRWPQVSVVGVHSPPFGFEHHDAALDTMIEAVNASRPDVLIVGLGAPKQELWVHRVRHDLHARVAICAGATIDFLAGEQDRAPAWMQRTGLEWAYRIWTDPRRLGPRYARDAAVFPRLAWGELRRRHSRQPAIDLREPPVDVVAAESVDADRYARTSVDRSA